MFELKSYREYNFPGGYYNDRNKSKEYPQPFAHRNLINNIILVIVPLLVYLYHWHKIQEKEKSPAER